MKKQPTIPDLVPQELRALANRIAQEDGGYEVRVMPIVSLGRGYMHVTFRAPDGFSFPGSISAERCLRKLKKEEQEKSKG